MRNTPEYKRNEESKEIKLWKRQINVLKKLDQQKDQIDQLEIEKELIEIENKWKSNFKLNEVSKLREIEIPQNQESENLFKLNELKEKSENLKQNFMKTMQIHKKPTDFVFLKQIFTFKVSRKCEQTVIGSGSIQFELDEKSFEQLLLIEYVYHRLDDLFTARTRLYLKENESADKPTINEERQKEEYEETCDKFITKNNLLFGNVLTTDNYDGPRARTVAHDDNGEEEMIAKLTHFEKSINALNNEALNNTNISDMELKKPLPNYIKLKEEAIKQQLKVKEFFSGFSQKPEQPTIIDQNDIETNDFNQSLIIKIKETNEEIVRILPTVDSKSQIKIRRKIFFDKLII